jgi:hypothetical protein
LGDNAFRLFDQGEQDVLGVDLVVPVALDNFGGALGRLLGALGESIKSHHDRFSSVIDIKSTSAGSKPERPLSKIQFSRGDR